MSELRALLGALRAACTSSSWSRGVELARSGAVAELAPPDEALHLRVVDDRRQLAVAVLLYPDEAEWDCDCGGEHDACEHAAAATIAVRAARKRGAALPGVAAGDGRLGYRLHALGDGLGLARVLVSPSGDERPFEGSFEGGDWQPGARRAVEPTAADRRIEAVLAARRVRRLHADALGPLLALLAQVGDVQLDGRPVVAVAEPLRPRAVLERAGAGWRLRIEAHPDLDRLVAPGVALCSDGGALPALRVLAETARLGVRWQALPRTEQIADERLAELVGRGVAELDRRYCLEVRCELPRPGGTARPRPAVELCHRGGALSLRALVVYGEPVTARLEGERLVHLGGRVPKRDRRGERAAAAVLRERLDLPLGKRVDLQGQQALRMAAALRSFDGALLGATALDRYPAEPLEPSCASDGASRSLRFVATGADGEPLEASAGAVLQAWQRGQGAVPLDGGGWARLPSAWLEQHGELVGDVLQAHGDRAPVARLALARLGRALGQAPPLDLAPLLELLDTGRAQGSPPLPADLTATLRPYQQRGIRWLCLLRDAGLGALLADDMGLGKTLQALCALRGRALVVCPTSVMHGWLQQAAQFRPALTVALYHGPRRRLEPSAEVTVTSYALLRGDLAVLAAERWDCLVLDEAQNIKNPDSQVARAAFSLRAGFRLAMTGTPLENRLQELWSQMRFTHPGLLGELSAFEARYAEPLSRGEAGAGDRLRRRIGPFLLRRTKAEVGTDLPARSETVLYCELDEREREAYRAIELAARRGAVARLRAGGELLEALEALLRLRQAACDLALVPGLGRQASARGAPASKLARLLAVLDEIVAEGHRALVFSQFTRLLDRVEPLLDERRIGFCRLDGSTRDRGAVVTAFQAEAGPPVMLVSLKAGGSGLNLTAADHVFLLDPWWNPAVEDQAADRAHRIGQRRAVLIHRLVSRGTVEERLLALQQRKRELAQAVLSGGALAEGLGREDLVALLEP